MKTKPLAVASALAVALLSSALLADDQSDSDASSQGDGSSSPAAIYGGTLGRTYLSIGADAQHFQDVASTPDALGMAFGANLPMTDNFDYTLGYGFDAARGHEFSLTDNAISNGVTGFYKFAHVTPFVAAGFGYDWERITSGITSISLPSRFDRMDYDLDAGLEFPLTDAASLKAGIGDDDASLRRPHAHDWDYEVSANYWLGSVVGTFVGADVKEGRGGALNATELTLGVRFLLGSD